MNSTGEEDYGLRDCVLDISVKKASYLMKNAKFMEAMGRLSEFNSDLLRRFGKLTSSRTQYFCNECGFVGRKVVLYKAGGANWRDADIIYEDDNFLEAYGYRDEGLRALCACGWSAAVVAEHP